MGLNHVAHRQEAKDPDTSCLNPSLKESLGKWEQDIKLSNLPEEKFMKPLQITGKQYKMVDPCFEEKMQELTTDFSNICISPRSQAAPWHPFMWFRSLNSKLTKHLYFSTAFNQVNV